MVLHSFELNTSSFSPSLSPSLQRRRVSPCSTPCRVGSISRNDPTLTLVGRVVRAVRLLKKFGNLRLIVMVSYLCHDACALLQGKLVECSLSFTRLCMMPLVSFLGLWSGWWRVGMQHCVCKRGFRHDDFSNGSEFFCRLWESRFSPFSTRFCYLRYLRAFMPPWPLISSAA